MDDSTIIFLAKNVTVDKYLELENQKDKISIAQFLYDRFAERYIEPFEKQPYRTKHGFSLMAINCLMIEAMMSFRLGYDDTKDKSKKCFLEFFNTANGFSDFIGYEKDFYKNIRCGILHQAETRGGWKIRREGILFNKRRLTVNATKFLSRLKEYLKEYQSELENSDWDSETWQNLRKKMASIIQNCIRS